MARGLFQNNTSVALSLATDGFEAWRQNGSHGWLVIATVLNLNPSTRSKNSSQVLVTISPGFKQSVDLESFLPPIADELKSLAVGRSGIHVAGSTERHTLTAFALQVQRTCQLVLSSSTPLATMVGAPIAFKTLVACFGALTTTINRSTRAPVRRFIPSPRLERLVVRKRGSSTQGLSSSKRRETDGVLSTSQI